MWWCTQVVLCVLFTFGACGGCPRGFNQSGSNCYMVSTKPLNFDEAEDTCRSFGRGFHLAMIKGKGEMATLVGMMKLKQGEYLIGYKKVQSDYQWIDGDKASPNVTFDAKDKGDCMAIHVSGTASAIRRMSCTDKRAFLCRGPVHVHNGTVLSSKNMTVGCAPLFIKSKGGLCYRYFYSEKTFDEAEARCESVRKGYHLVSIHNIRDSARLRSFFQKQLMGKNVWIGLSKSGANDAWTDGSSFSKARTRRNWDRKSKSTAKNCTALSRGRKGLPKWERVHCQEKHTFICKGSTWDIVDVTAPPAHVVLTVPASGSGGGRRGGNSGGRGSGYGDGQVFMPIPEMDNKKTLHGLTLTKGPCVTVKDGPHGMKAWYFGGGHHCFLSIANNGKLNFKSFTIAMFIYYELYRDSPLVEWYGMSKECGVHLWVFNNHIHLNLMENDNTYHPATGPTPAIRQWNFVGVSYDHKTGTVTMWVDSDHKLHDLGVFTGDTNYDMYFGIRPKNPTKPHFKGYMAGITVIGASTKAGQIESLKKDIVKKNKA